MNKEMKIYKVLNADDPKIEDNQIPRVYFNGKIFGKHYAIALSLFEGTLGDYYAEDNPKKSRLSDVDILYVFLQAVKGLKYLSSKNVVHNDIKPNNLFYRGREVFVGDFDQSSLNGEKSLGNTPLFASANYFANKTRHPRDDLESLVYTIWFLAGVPMEMIKDEKSPIPAFIRISEGRALFENLKKGKTNARQKIMKKCKYLKNKYVRGVFEDIWDSELLAPSDQTVPHYDGIIVIIIDAINSISKNKHAIQGDWFSDGCCAVLSFCS
ncbi:casein kinase I-like [Contarinia nasturtii]|uniref:casein kinase I-like n=1 Tax=Contarinia nasturtii TaxID=265458 RepID=UPI0012D3B32B|nr:casein kinase I-like [Contarinia nasturtii]